MNRFRLITAVAIAGVVSAMPAAAQGKSGSHGGGATTHAGPATTPTGNTTHGKPADAGTHGPSANAGTHARNGDAAANGKSGKSGDTATRGKSGDARTRGDSDDLDVRSDNGRPGKNGRTTADAGANAIAAKISRNPNQLARITAMLPPGMTLDQATAGFRNQGQFIAALNASKNQNVPFADLQKAMTVDGQSLGQAVRKLREPAASNTTGGTTTTTGGTTTTSSNTSAS
jgi:hypothetical protein